MRYSGIGTGSGRGTACAQGAGEQHWRIFLRPLTDHQPTPNDKKCRLKAGIVMTAHEVAMQVYARTTINEGHPTERTFRVVRHPDRGGWDVQCNRGNLGWKSRRTFYSLATALREMDAWAKEERVRLAAATVLEAPHEIAATLWDPLTANRRTIINSSSALRRS
jgi:hypothetical protein